MSARTRGVVAFPILSPVLLPAVLAVVLSGCTGAVEVDAPRLDAETEHACGDLLDALPERVADLDPREVDPSDSPARAWGDPPVTVTCGVDAPRDFDRFSPCEEVDGVGWYVPREQVEDQSADVELTTIGVEPRVRLTVPAELRPPAGILVQVSAAVRSSLGVEEPCV